MRCLSATLLIVATLLLVGCQAEPAPDAGQLEDYRARVSVLEQERDELESTVLDLEGRIEELESRLEEEDLAPTDWSPEGLVFSFPMREYLRRVDVEGWSPGCTRWHDDPDLLDALASGPGVSGPESGSLVLSIADYLAGSVLGVDVWEVTSRVLMTGEGTATGIVALWGLMDDSVAGIDYLLQLEQQDEAWTITGVEVRYHCRRGTDGDVCY